MESVGGGFLGERRKMKGKNGESGDRVSGDVRGEWRRCGDVRR